MKIATFILKVIFLLIFCTGCKMEHYLSDKDKTYENIEIFQKDYSSNNFALQKLKKESFTKRTAYKLLIQATSSLNSFSFESNSEEMRAEYKRMFNKYIPDLYPTRYQDPFEYLIFAQVIEEIDKKAKQLYPKLNYTPKYGTFYANSIDAERKSLKDDYLLLIHSRYVTFCHQMGKVALQPFHFKNVGGIAMDTSTIKYEIRLNSGINLNFFYTFLEFNYLKFPPNDSLFLNDGFFEKPLQYWNNSSETFLLGHEYAHALFKHKMEDVDFLSDTVLLKSWYNEIEADSISQEILNKIVQEKVSDQYKVGWNKYLLSGGIFYLNTLKIFERGQSILNNDKEIPSLPNEDFSTILEILKNKSDFYENLKKFNSLNPFFTKFDHPPTEIRIELIKQLYDRQVNQIWHNKNDLDQAENFHKELAEKMIYAINGMNESSKQAFYNSYKVKDLLNQKFQK